MEALLSLAFDNLSSFDAPKIRKGLRQVEGLLAQICLSNPNRAKHSQPQTSSSSTSSTSSTSASASVSVSASASASSASTASSASAFTSASSSSASTYTSTTISTQATATRHHDPDDGANDNDSIHHRYNDNNHDDDDDDDDDDAAPPPPPPHKNLAQLSRDPAFREFFKLQEGFEWNVAMRLINTLDRLMAKGSDGQNDLLILSALDLTQGVLLLHPPSKLLFSREQNMNLLLDLLEPYNCPAIQSATLLTLVVALIDTPSNARAFEGLEGLLTITSLFKSRNTAREVKLKLVEFLYFYLMPESPPTSPTEKHKTNSFAPSKHVHAAAAANAAAGTLTTEEKQLLLSRHLSSVEDLVKDLRNLSPFGGMVC